MSGLFARRLTIDRIAAGNATGICSYRRLCWRYRYIVFGIVALIGFWTIKGYVRRWYANDYDKLPEGAPGL